MTALVVAANVLAAVLDRGEARRRDLLAEAAVPGDWVPAAALVARYAALPLGLVDAIVAATAARLGAVLATYDRRHFSWCACPVNAVRRYRAR